MEKISEPVRNESANTTSESRGEIPKVNFQRAEEIWGKSFTSVTELFETKNEFGSQLIKTYPHMIGRKEENLNLIPYNNGLGMAQVDLCRFISPGEIAISVKHHSPSPTELKLDDLKFQCTHIQTVVGVKNGVMTVNNPDNYENGLLGEDNYPMIFLKPKFPDHISISKQKSYTDNIRTWLVIANTFSKFPGDYDGGDPLGCVDKYRVLEFGNALIRALLGDQSAKDWLANSEQKLYCAELAYVSLNLGIHFPLNRQYLGPAFDSVQEKIIQKSFFPNNRNPYIAEVDLVMAPDDLVPVMVDGESELAIEPFFSSDIVYHYIQKTVPRNILGEAVGSKIQSTLFENIKPMLPDFLRLESQAEKLEFEILIQKAFKIVSTVYPSYSDFKFALKPVFDEMREFSKNNGMAYIPPHCFLIRALEYSDGKKAKGFFEWEYLGHGLYSTILNR